MIFLKPIYILLTVALLMCAGASAQTKFNLTSQIDVSHGMPSALPMNGYKVTGMANGTASQDAVTYSQLNSLTPAASNTDGWIAAGETWSYRAAGTDDPTYGFNISTDKTSKYSVGMKLRLSQSTGGTKYFRISKISYSAPNTMVWCYGGTDYNLENEAISSPYYSTSSNPYGFPQEKSKWSVIVTSTADRSKATPTATTWYVASENITVPIGYWRLSFSCQGFCDTPTTGASDIWVALSTSTSSSSNNALMLRAYAGSGDVIAVGLAEDLIAVTTKTPYYLIMKTALSSEDYIKVVGSTRTTRIAAEWVDP